MPFVAPYRWASGLNYGFTKVVVEVETEGGLIGLGEAANWRHAEIIKAVLAPPLLGESALDIHRCWQVAVPPSETLNNTENNDVVRAFGAIEMALWDIRARAAEVPLYLLLGGKCRGRVPFTEYFAPRPRTEEGGGEETPEELGEYCARMVAEHGSSDFEGKVGFADRDTDVRIVECVREAIGPTRTLAVDANTGWRGSTARELLHRFVPLRLRFVEDPVAGYEEMAKLRLHSSIPFSTHVANLPAAIRLGVPDSFALNLTTLGGIFRTRQFIAACQASGIGFTFYSGETGVGVAAYLHVGASEPYLSQPSQSLLRWYTRDIIYGGPFSPENGVLTVPEGSGLGVSLDQEVLSVAHREFLRDGPIESMVSESESGLFPQLPLY
jgi:glucarate dehydratase